MIPRETINFRINDITANDQNITFNPSKGNSPAIARASRKEMKLVEPESLGQDYSTMTITVDAAGWQ